MLRTAALITSVFAALMIAALTSCNRPPTTPSPTLPPLPPQTVTTRVELIAPQSLAPGASEQLRLVAHRSDGTTVDITTSASFSSSKPDILAITPPGMATAIRLGESFARAQSNSFSSTREVVVVPPRSRNVARRSWDESAAPSSRRLSAPPSTCSLAWLNRRRRSWPSSTTLTTTTLAWSRSSTRRPLSCRQGRSRSRLLRAALEARSTAGSFSSRRCRLAARGHTRPAIRAHIKWR